MPGWVVTGYRVSDSERPSVMERCATDFARDLALERFLADDCERVTVERDRSFARLPPDDCSNRSC